MWFNVVCTTIRVITVVKMSCAAAFSVTQVLSGSLSKSGPLDFGTKNNFPSFFVSEKGLAHIYIKKQFIIFQFLIFALLRAKIEFWPNCSCLA